MDCSGRGPTEWWFATWIGSRFTWCDLVVGRLDTSIESPVVLVPLSIRGIKAGLAWDWPISRWIGCVVVSNLSLGETNRHSLQLACSQVSDTFVCFV